MLRKNRMCPWKDCRCVHWSYIYIICILYNVCVYGSLWRHCVFFYTVRYILILFFFIWARQLPVILCPHWECFYRTTFPFILPGVWWFGKKLYTKDLLKNNHYCLVKSRCSLLHHFISSAKEVVFSPHHCVSVRLCVRYLKVQHGFALKANGFFIPNQKGVWQ